MNLVNLSKLRIFIATSITHILLVASISSAGTLPVGTVGVKWHPGHYYHLMSSNPTIDSFGVKEALKTIEASNSGFAGLEIRLTWKVLEPTMGNYQYALIDGLLNHFATTKKRLVLFIYHKGNDPDGVVPNYIKTSQYQGGAYRYTSSINSSVNGENAKFWVPEVRDRFKALLTALGNRYNRHTHFEGLLLPETAMGTPINTTITDAQEAAYFSGLVDINQTLRQKFPNTMTSQFVNFPRSRLSTLIGALKNMGASIGGPDIFITDKGLNAPDGAYSYYPKLSNIVALTPSIMTEDYNRTCGSLYKCVNHDPTVDELLDFGRDNLKANYLFWTMTAKDGDEVAAKLHNLTINNSTRVRLNTTCPSKLSPCIKN